MLTQTCKGAVRCGGGLAVLSSVTTLFFPAASKGDGAGVKVFCLFQLHFKPLILDTQVITDGILLGMEVILVLVMVAIGNANLS